MTTIYHKIINTNLHKLILKFWYFFNGLDLTTLQELSNLVKSG